MNLCSIEPWHQQGFTEDILQKPKYVIQKHSRAPSEMAVLRVVMSLPDKSPADTADRRGVIQTLMTDREGEQEVEDNTLKGSGAATASKHIQVVEMPSA